MLMHFVDFRIKWKFRFRLIPTVLGILALCLFVNALQEEDFQTDNYLYPFLFTPAYMTKVNGMAVTFAMDLKFVAVDKPDGYEKLRKMLNMDSFDWAELGHTDLLPAGHQLGTPELLFEKIEDDVIQAQVDKLLATKKANEAATYKANPIKPTIAFEDFEKLDIRVGTVLECEAVPKMKKLLKFKIADGLENRTIVSGIAQHYKPEELVGKQVLFIANLAPRQFKNGLVSEVMILSAKNYDGSLAVTSLLKEVKPGSEVK